MNSDEPEPLVSVWALAAVGVTALLVGLAGVSLGVRPAGWQLAAAGLGMWMLSAAFDLVWIVAGRSRRRFLAVSHKAVVSFV